MRSVKSSVRSWKTVGICFAVLFVILLQARAGWSQEPAQPRLDEEFTKQEKIYRSRGADVPSGYVINRGLPNYAEVLPAGFCDALGRLAARTDGWISARAPGRPYWTTMHRKAMRLLKSAADPAPRRAWSRSP